MINMQITFGYEMSEEDARRQAKYLIGDEADELTAEECAIVWAETEMNYGLGCEAKVL